MRLNKKTSAFLICLFIAPAGLAHAQRRHSSYPVRTGHTADSSALSIATARQNAQKTELKRLESQSARLAAAAPSEKNSTQRIKPLKLGSRSGGQMNFSGKTPKIHAASGGRGGGARRSLVRRRH